MPVRHFSSHFAALQGFLLLFFFLFSLSKLPSVLSYKKPIMRGSAALSTNRKQFEQDFSARRLFCVSF